MADTEDQDALPSTAQSKVGAARLMRASVAVVIILASAGTGYVASRLWPLQTRPQPVMSLATTANLETRQPEATDARPGGDLARAADVVAPTAPAQPVARARPDEAAVQPKEEEPAALPVRPAPPIASPVPTPTEQGRADDSVAPRIRQEEAGKVAPDSPRRDLGATKLYRAARPQRNRAATSKYAQSPPAGTGYRNTPVLREFMGNPNTQF